MAETSNAGLRHNVALFCVRLVTWRSLPGKVPFYFELQGYAEKGANENDESENDYVVESRRNNDRANNCLLR